MWGTALVTGAPRFFLLTHSRLVPPSLTKITNGVFGDITAK